MASARLIFEGTRISKRRDRIVRLIRCVLTVGMLFGFNLITPLWHAMSASNEVVYTDALSPTWTDWSWDSAVNFSTTSTVYGGTNAVAVTSIAGWAGLYLHSDAALNGADFDSLSFWIHGGNSGGQAIRVSIYDTASHSAGSVDIAPLSFVWTHVQISMTTFGNPAVISGIVWQSMSANVQPPYFLDSISLVAGSGVTSIGQGPGLQVDVSAGRHRISPYIYGMNFAPEGLAAELHLPVNRWGGNSTSRYNWQNDFSNLASDWFYENYYFGGNASADAFVSQNKRTGTASLITLPMMGWVAKNSPAQHPFACGFKSSRYGVQQQTDPYDADCGNGYHTNGTPYTGNDPQDTSVAITSTFVQQWITHFGSTFGSSQNGGVQFYNLDNEPNLWNSTQRDVHPQPLSYDELLSRTVQYAAAVKSVDPNAQVLGPAEWGWTNYFYSAKDAASGGNWTANPPDRNAHGGIPLVPWYLQQLHSSDQARGQRTLDYLDLHYYPQASNVSLTDIVDAGTQALRLRSTRSLWDPTYADESWIKDTDGGPAVQLIPRMRNWVNLNYSGTKIAIGEYNWGAIGYLNGALAQADVLGIFGREGVDLATLWGPPTSLQPVAYAFRLFRNYDGSGAAFGELSVQAHSADQGVLSTYAALRDRDRALTIVVINKTQAALTTTLSLAHFNPVGFASVYRYSGANLSAITHLPNQIVSSTGFTATYPASSITVFDIPDAIVTGSFRTYVPVVLR